MVIKGAVDVLLDRMTLIQIGDEVRPLTENDRRNIEDQNQRFSEKVSEYWHLDIRLCRTRKS